MAHPLARLGDLRARHPAVEARMIGAAGLAALTANHRGAAEAKQRKQRRLGHAFCSVEPDIIEYSLPSERPEPNLQRRTDGRVASGYEVLDR